MPGAELVCGLLACVQRTRGCQQHAGEQRPHKATTSLWALVCRVQSAASMCLGQALAQLARLLSESHKSCTTGKSGLAKSVG